MKLATNNPLMRFFWNLVTPINNFAFDFVNQDIRMDLRWELNKANLSETYMRVKEMLREEEL